MYLKHLQLTDYRNYAELSVDFDANKIILLGDNAQGKTNLLEALALLATGKSPTAQKDAELVRWGAEQAVVRSELERELSTMSIDMLIRPNGRRAVRINGLHQRRLADLFGKLLVVVFRSEDLHLVKGSPTERRAYLDDMLVQLSGTYYQRRHDYERVVTQRNRLLKAISEGRAEHEHLEGWDEQLIQLAIALWKYRIRLVEALSPLVAFWHEHIAEGKERLSMAYLPSIPLGSDPSTWEGAMRSALAQARASETARHQTLVGPHRDDLELLIDGRPARAFGSQGQQRTVALSLKLAELEHIRATTGEAPLLLLDDVLAELDVRRQNALLASIGEGVQTFVTSTHLNDFSAVWLEQAAIYHVEKGQLTLMKSTAR